MSAIVDYTKKVDENFKSGHATEHSYRAELQDLLKSIGGDDVQVINEPKRQGSNAPDYYISRDVLTIGFVEAKDIDKNLSLVETSEQLLRYRDAYNNLLLTNYLEFRWYVEGEYQEQVTIGEIQSGKIQFRDADFDALGSMLRRYYAAEVPEIISPEDLARRMAKMTRELARLIEDAIENKDNPSQDLLSKKEAVARVLLPNLTNRQFADMFAQTIAYGLFAARARYTGKPEQFTLEKAFFQLPKTNPFLQKLFQNIATELDTRVRFMADVIAQLLAYAKNIEEVIANFGHSTRQQDPVIHFYETFLNAYDAQQRERRGVYYTPEPVVSYIVRSVDHILKETFGRNKGLADNETLILDPATGTGTFLYKVIQQIHDSMSGQMGAWQSYVQKNLLKRLFGFELLMAPYTVAHMKLNLLLGELGYDFSQNDRLEIYLTNALDENLKQPTLPFAEYLTEEANAATIVKTSEPIMVVLGNPPYSIHSANQSDYIDNLMDSYKEAVRSERNIQPLSDDYIKFIRFAHDRIERTGYGVVGFITNHTYLSGLIHRGMRQQLLTSFDEIYILNLHGNALVGLTTPDGQSDRNVFDIRQGVSIVFLVKTNTEKQMADVFYDELWGSRNSKYQFLSENHISTTNWEKLKPTQPNYFFIPRVTTNKKEYEKNWKITETFQNHSTGFETGKDKVLVGSEDEIRNLVNDLVNATITDKQIEDRYSIKNTSGWPVTRRRESMIEEGFDEKYLRRVSYRPFNEPYTYYHGFLRRAQFDNLSHLLQPNLALVTSRMIKGEQPNHAFVTEKPLEKIFLSPKTSNNAFVIPLYLYPEQRAGEMFALDDDGSAWPLSAKGRRPNLNPDFVREMEAKLGLTFVPENTPTPSQSVGEQTPPPDPLPDFKEGEVFYPEDVFHYAYAVFHSPTYRERYAEFLKIDFPRLPLTSDVDLFRTLCTKGEQLVVWHLLKKQDIGSVTYPESGGNIVTRRGYPRFDEDEERVYINKTQYFGNVPQSAWDFHIGGYQVLHKWLKDRRDRELSFEDIEHYECIVTALIHTMQLMDEIDAAIPDWPIV